jgi:2,4-dienoyl-CoA reductase-like NADH-dependent reductase (Old Yellow Enzyme family)
MSMATSTPTAVETIDQAVTEILFQPFQLGRHKLRHRMVMPPLTRSRARQPGNVPPPMNACYYAQRSSAALIEAVIKVWNADRVGVRLSPLGTFNDICDQNPEETFGGVARRLNEYGLAYLHLVDPAIAEIEKEWSPIRVQTRCSS